ncbi:MAG: hypothetical protein QN229_06480 [Desulfurococcaceae archaeon TW002]
MRSIVNVSIKEIKESENLYDVILSIKYMDRSYELCLHRITQKAANVEADLRGDHLYIKLMNEKNEGFATCCIHVKHLESGCMECPSLLLPPSKTNYKDS